MRDNQITPIDIQITGKLLGSIADEMGIVLQKSAFSPNIKERCDFSCAIFDRQGRLLAQAAHIPVHLGAMPLTTKYILERFKLEDGDIVITNDPFSGGSHLPDITLMEGVFIPEYGDDALFYVMNRAHHADVGGITPGSMPLAQSLSDEGVLIEPCLLQRGGELDKKLLERIVSRMRNPDERRGDLGAQMAALERGIKRLNELASQQDASRLEKKLSSLLDYGRLVMENIISEMPDGQWQFRDFLDDDGAGSPPVPIEVTLRIKSGKAVLDFSRSADQVKTGLNTVTSVTHSAVYYCFFCLVEEGYPVNDGSLKPIRIITRKGSVVDACPGAPVAAGNVETSQRIVDCVLGALAQAIPDRIPAASAGTMNNIAIGGPLNEGGEFAYYETLAGGMGARPGSDGLSAVQVHMTNTRNTPIEVIEQEYPMRIEEYSIRQGSGGAGRFKGGDGLLRSYQFLSPATITLLTERRRLAPYGLHGGPAGQCGKNIFYSAKSNKESVIPGKTHIEAKAGDRLTILTPGGGGWGTP